MKEKYRFYVRAPGLIEQYRYQPVNSLSYPIGEPQPYIVYPGSWPLYEEQHYRLPTMLPYDKAATGDLDFIKQYLADCPTLDLINRPWDGDTSSDLFIGSTSHDRSMTPIAVSGAVTIAALVSGAWLVAGASYALGMYKTHSIAETYGKRKGWTLLEFAADAGQIDVALHLIALEPALLNQARFLEIAAQANQHEFIKRIQREKEHQARHLTRENKLQELEGKIKAATENNRELAQSLEQYQLDSIKNNYQQKINHNYSMHTIDSLRQCSDQFHLFPEEVQHQIQAGSTTIGHELFHAYVKITEQYLQELRNQKNNPLRSQAIRNQYQEEINKTETILQDFKTNNPNIQSNPTPARVSRTGLFSQSAPEDRQRGWNCFDLATGLGDRQQFVNYVLGLSNNEYCRSLLAVEIKMAALVHDGTGLPAAMRTEEVTTIVANYLNADEAMKPAVATCNDALGYRSGNRLPLSDLLDFFEKPENVGYRNSTTYNDFMTAYRALYEPAYLAFEAYANREDIYRLYVSDYYGKNGWFVFHNAFSGEKNKASIVNIVAHYKQANIVIYLNDEICYQTELNFNNNPIEINWNGSNHFVKRSEQPTQSMSMN